MAPAEAEDDEELARQQWYAAPHSVCSPADAMSDEALKKIQYELAVVEKEMLERQETLSEVDKRLDALQQPPGSRVDALQHTPEHAAPVRLGVSLDPVEELAAEEQVAARTKTNVAALAAAAGSTVAAASQSVAGGAAVAGPSNTSKGAVVGKASMPGQFAVDVLTKASAVQQPPLIAEPSTNNGASVGAVAAYASPRQVTAAPDVPVFATAPAVVGGHVVAVDRHGQDATAYYADLVATPRRQAREPESSSAAPNSTAMMVGPPKAAPGTSTPNEGAARVVPSMQGFVHRQSTTPQRSGAATAAVPPVGQSLTRTGAQDPVMRMSSAPVAAQSMTIRKSAPFGYGSSSQQPSQRPMASAVAATPRGGSGPLGRYPSPEVFSSQASRAMSPRGPGSSLGAAATGSGGRNEQPLFGYTAGRSTAGAVSPRGVSPNVAAVAGSRGAISEPSGSHTNSGHFSVSSRAVSPSVNLRSGGAATPTQPRGGVVSFVQPSATAPCVHGVPQVLSPRSTLTPMQTGARVMAFVPPGNGSTSSSLKDPAPDRNLYGTTHPPISLYQSPPSQGSYPQYGSRFSAVNPAGGTSASSTAAARTPSATGAASSRRTGATSPIRRGAPGEPAGAGTGAAYAQPCHGGGAAGVAAAGVPFQGNSRFVPVTPGTTAQASLGTSLSPRPQASSAGAADGPANQFGTQLSPRTGQLPQRHGATSVGAPPPFSSPPVSRYAYVGGARQARS